MGRKGRKKMPSNNAKYTQEFREETARKNAESDEENLLDEL